MTRAEGYARPGERDVSIEARRTSPDAEEADTVSSRPTASGITFVVPAFNEENGIEEVLRRLAALPLRGNCELLVVNDGSVDGTRQVLARLEEQIPSLRVIEHGINRGYGAALKTGFTAARHDVIVITDADATYPENKIVDLLARIDDGAEMAVGARTGEEVNVPFARRPAKACLRLLASYLAGTPIPDLNSGLRAFRRDLVQLYRPILPDGFSFTTTITLAALTNGHRVDYVSIDYAARKGRSKIRPIRDTLRFTALIVRTVLYFNPLKVFYPLTGALGIVFLASLFYDLFLVKGGANLGDKTVLLFVAMVQILTVGLLADVIEKRSRL